MVEVIWLFLNIFFLQIASLNAEFLNITFLRIGHWKCVKDLRSDGQVW